MDAPVKVVISPSLVQGLEAPAELVQALEDLSKYGEVDVIIIGRGGGSFEDLLAFSDERVVRAVADCPVPIVSAVGHETDVVLTDLAADARAATPSAAAELVTQGRDDLLAGLSYYGSRLTSAARLAVGEAREQVAFIGSRLVHPRHILEQGRLRPLQPLVDIAARHTVSPFQIALAWTLAQEGVAAIPKATDPAHVRENIAAQDIRLWHVDHEVVVAVQAVQR